MDAVYGRRPMNPTTCSRGAGVPSVDQVLDKYLQAIGGARTSRASPASSPREERRLSRVRRRRRRRVSAQAPDKRATHISFPEYPDRGVSVRTYDGRPAGSPRRSPSSEIRAGGKRARRRETGRDAVLPDADHAGAHDLRVGPPSTIGDKDVTVLQGNGPNGTLATLYFDDASGCWCGWCVMAVADRPRADAGGLRRLPRCRRIKFPFRWTFAWLDGRDNFEFSDVK
jgi:hypothetical protein